MFLLIADQFRKRDNSWDLETKKNAFKKVDFGCNRRGEAMDIPRNVKSLQPWIPVQRLLDVTAANER